MICPSPALVAKSIRPGPAAANGAPKPPVIAAAARTDAMDSTAPGTCRVGMRYCSVNPVMRSGYAASWRGAIVTVRLAAAPRAGSAPAGSR